MTRISEILAAMIACPGNTPHDIEHLLKVWGFARTIGELEGLPAKEQRHLEIAAIVHDIACPTLRKRTGSCNGKLQERKGAPMAEAFLESCGVDADDIAAVSFLVAHHHTLEGVDRLTWQILLEADYLVNAGESHYSEANIRRFAETICRTSVGRALLTAIYHV